MDWSIPLSPIVQSLEGVVLDRLYRVQGPQSIGEIHRKAGKGSLSGVRFALERLVEQGLVSASRIGNLVAYELNTDHLAYPALQAALDAYRPYALLRERLHDLVVGELGDIDIPSVALYGSVARREATAGSDVDLLVVAPLGQSDDATSDVFAMAGNLHEHVSRWTGNAAQVVATTARDLLAAYRAGDPFALALAVEADTVVGRDVRALLAASVADA